MQLEAPRRKKRPNPRKRAFRMIGLVVAHLLVALLTVMTAVAHGFHRTGSSLAATVLVPIATCAVSVLLIILYRWSISSNRKEFWRSIKTMTTKRLAVELTCLALWIVFVAMLFSALHGICFCLWNDNIPSLSTTLTRSLIIKQKVCPDGKICRLFVTLP